MKPDKGGQTVRVLAARLFFWLALSACAWPAGQARASDWVSERNGPEGQATLYAPAAQPLKEWYYFYKTTMRYRPGLAVWASPALADVADHPLAFIGGHTQTLLALDLEDRRVAWLKVTNGEITAAPAVGEVRGRPVVFFTSADRSVYALEAASGETVWTRELFPASPTLGHALLTAPVLHAGRLYLTAFVYDKSLARNQQRAWLLCLDQASGDELWRIAAGNGAVNSAVGFEALGRFYLAWSSRKGVVQCWQAEPGPARLVWKYQMPQEVFGSPVVQTAPAPRLYIGSKFGNLACLDALTGRRLWQRLAGHWIDNSACLGSWEGQTAVFVGSHDYRLYAYDAEDGHLLWSLALGGEVYTAPVFFRTGNGPRVAAACLDNRLYVAQASTGKLETAFFIGEPLWDKAPKGETPLGSPAAVVTAADAALVLGSHSGIIGVFPLKQPSQFRDRPRSFRGLWLSVPAVVLVFLGVVLPVLLRWRGRS
ncbi:MAG: PQQ-binding-like beta-propeller repeat protein [candidate division FCPU426 bacterium]